VEVTCCVPHPREPLRRRFPAVRWLDYTPAARQACIETCDVWLGLGGAPWQTAVSSWFAEHLEVETALCAALGRPMYFLGVGGQDRSAYAAPALRRAGEQAVAVWTRDDRVAEALAGLLPPGRVRAAADPAHLFFAAHPPAPARPGRLTAVLNFDYGAWPGLAAALAALHRLPAADRIWLAQESRPLPGAELALFSGLDAAERGLWRLQLADTPGDPLPDAFARWPAGEWLLTSRYHATLASAWAGSRTVVLATNEKLRSVAAECGYPLLPLEADPAILPGLLQDSAPPPTARMRERAEVARKACREFFAAIGL